jgi:hypothetical protein
MKSKSNQHPCLYCNSLIPLNKKYCNKECYNKSKNTEIICKGCNNKFVVPLNKSDRKFCSIKCSNSTIDRKETRIKAINTLKQKYNVENPFEIKGYDNLNIKRNGDKISESFNKKSPEEKKEIKDKRIESFNKKSPEEKKEIRDKIKQTNLELYNTPCPLSKDSPFRKKADLNNSNSYINKLNEWLKKHNLELLDPYVGVKNKNGDIIYYNFRHIPTNSIFKDHVACGRLPKYKDPNVTIGTSDQEKEIQNFIQDLLPTAEIFFNTRHLVKGFEIDIYLPEYNIAIEYNGLYWHSEKNGKLSEYHISKTKKCEEKNIQLIHIFEDEWVYKKDIVKSRLKSLLNKNDIKIYARKCILKEISNKEKNNFLNQYHIQGEDKSKIKLGLFYKDELVSVMTFGRLRKITGNNHQEGVYELIRFSSKSNTTVIGGFSKLLKNFVKIYKPKNIISYADRRWSMGKIYENNNFVFIHDTLPNYWYMKYYKNREHRYKYRKSELPSLLDNFNPLLSEWENMKKNKFDRIWDCGSKKYIYTP